jgi:hypothetical protein
MSEWSLNSINYQYSIKYQGIKPITTTQDIESQSEVADMTESTSLLIAITYYPRMKKTSYDGLQMYPECNKQDICTDFGCLSSLKVIAIRG